MKNFLIGLGAVILLILGFVWYQKNNQTAVSSRPESVVSVTPTTTPAVSAASTDQAEMYLEQSEEGIKVLEELGIK